MDEDLDEDLELEDENNEDDDAPQESPTNALAEKAKEEAKKKIKSVVKKKALTLMANPYFWIVVGCVLAVILIIALIFMISASIASSYAGLLNENVNIAEGQFATAYGIKNDSFYGARFIYKDDDQALIKLTYDYGSYSLGILQGLDNIEGVSVNIELDDEFDAEKENTTLNEMSLIISRTIYGDYTTTSQLSTLNEYLIAIPQFGFGKKYDNVLENISKYLLDNQTTYQDTIDTSKLLSIKDTNISSTVEDYISNIVEDISNNSFSYLKKKTEKLFIQDIILTEEKEMLTSLPSRTYVACIYMAKENVKVTSLTFMFNVLGEEAITSSCDYVNNGETTNIFTENPDSSWIQNDAVDKTTEKYNGNWQLNKFENIDENNLSLLEKENISLLDIAKETYASKYLTAKTVDGEEILDFTPNTNSAYIILTFTSNTTFQFAEVETEYSK